MSEHEKRDQVPEEILGEVSGGARPVYELVCACGRRRDWAEGADRICECGKKMDRRPKRHPTYANYAGFMD